MNAEESFTRYYEARKKIKPEINFEDASHAFYAAWVFANQTILAEILAMHTEKKKRKKQ